MMVTTILLQPEQAARVTKKAKDYGCEIYECSDVIDKKTERKIITGKRVAIYGEFDNVKQLLQIAK